MRRRVELVLGVRNAPKTIVEYSSQDAWLTWLSEHPGKEESTSQKGSELCSFGAVLSAKEEWCRESQYLSGYGDYDCWSYSAMAATKVIHYDHRAVARSTGDHFDNYVEYIYEHLFFESGVAAIQLEVRERI